VKNWNRTRCFVRQRKVIYGKGEDNILGQENVILLAGEVVHGTGEVVYGSGEFDLMGQEKMIRWDRRSCIWIKRVHLNRTGEND
jgi:hypothetical protein